jgi:hypothetical protein
MPVQEEFLNVRGVKIQLLKGGSGEPLLYLHSAGGEVVWLPFFEQPEAAAKMLTEFFGT